MIRKNPWYYCRIETQGKDTMASLDKRSVRDEFDKIKSDLDQLSKDGKVSVEVGLVIRSLFTLLEIVLAIFMEKKTKKTSNNSGIPPSQTDPDETATDASDGGSNRKKRKFKNNDFDNRTETVTVEVLQPVYCDACQTDLTDTPESTRERRTLIDILFEKTTTHVDVIEKVCPTCNARNKPDFPKQMAGPLQYGSGIKAFILNLLLVQMVALNRIQSFLSAIIDQVISEATMLKYVLQLHRALERWENESFEYLLKQLVVNVDETSLKVDKQRRWIHVYASGPVTLKKLVKGRSIADIESINLIPRYHGVIVHDCLAAYLSFTHCRHGLCGSHLLRELQFIIESNHYNWARQMKRLLKHISRVVSARNNKKLTVKEYKQLVRLYRKILTEGIQEMPEIPAKPKGQRGRVAKSDAHNLWQRLKDHRRSVLMFARKSAVPFTNNRAEQDLRMAKVKQKVSGCFRSQVYAEAYCRISSYIQTMTAKGHNPMAAIQMALSREIYNT